MKLLKKIFKDPLRILGILVLAFAIYQAGRYAMEDMEIKDLTYEKCTMEAEGVTIDYTYGTKRRLGTSSKGYGTSVYYDVIEYEVDNKVYTITSRHAYSSKPVVGATTTVYYNPEDPSKAFDNSEPYVETERYFYSVMLSFTGLILLFRIDKIIPSNKRR